MNIMRGECEAHAGCKSGSLWVAPQPPYHGHVAQRKSAAGVSRRRSEVQVLSCPPIFQAGRV